MAFPRTEAELEAAGYEFENAGRCRACQAEIAWYRTPAGKRMPLDEGTLEPHWSTCPNADDFRKKKVSHG